MRKYSDLCPVDAAPQLQFDLPGLDYPERLNAVETVLEGAIQSGWADRPAFYTNETTITFDQVRRDVHKYAAGFRTLGIDKGDAVILRLPDSIEMVCAVLAVQAIGGIAVPTYVQLRSQELIYRAEDSDAKLILVSENLLEEAKPVAAARHGKTEIVVFPTDSAGQLRGFVDALPSGDVPSDYADVDGEEVCLLLYTSGSTGEPKGTCHCHRDMLAIADTYWRNSISPGPDDVLGGPPSIAFALGFGMFIYFPLRLGHSAVLEADKSPEKALALIERHGVTIFAGVVSYLNNLARLARDIDSNLSSLRRVMVGGEPLSEENERRWLEQTGLPLEQFFGTTEMLHCFVTSSKPADPPHPAVLGHAIPGYELAVLDVDTFAPLPVGEQGLLATRGPTGTVYWNKPEQQRKVVRNGWNIFQDIVWADAEGNYHYVSRYDDMIISSGYNISPVQVEEALMGHSSVIECACVPTPDPTGRRETVVKAFIVTADGTVEDDDLVKSLQDHVKKVAAPYMYPRVVEFRPELPKTINGKILRSELRKIA